MEHKAHQRLWAEAQVSQFSVKLIVSALTIHYI